MFTCGRTCTRTCLIHYLVFFISDIQTFSKTYFNKFAYDIKYQLPRFLISQFQTRLETSMKKQRLKLRIEILYQQDILMQLQTQDTSI